LLGGDDLKADILIINGQCINSTDCVVYNWIAIKKDKIVGIGMGNEYSEFALSCGEIIDAKGSTVTAGFYDSHSHLVQTAIDHVSLNLSMATSFNDIGDLILEQVKKNPSKPIRGIRLDEQNLKEKRLPDRYILDKFCDTLPIWINRVEYHTSILNTYALLHYKVPFSVAGIELESNGMPTGIFSGYANALLREGILNNMNNNLRLKSLEIVMTSLISSGITTTASMEGGFMFCDKDAEFINEYKNSFPIDVVLFYQTTDVQKVKNMGLNRIGGSLFIDGSFGSRNAALYDDYTDAPGKKGVLYYSAEELNAFLLDCYENNLQTALHVIGERAIDLALDAHEYAFKKTGNNTLRHRLEHVELPTASHLTRSKQLNLIYSVQPAYEYYWGGPSKMYFNRIGDRYKITNPFKTIIEKGITLCGGSDSDVTPASPIMGIHSAVNHPVEKHRISIIEAIKMFTINAAYAMFEEQTKGSLDVGKLADIVILSDDLFKIPIESIKDVKVKVTIKSGNVLFNSIPLQGGE
jgi:predicted amidohydrolase YtcJ